MLCLSCNSIEVVQPPTGRRRKYCSDECKFAARNKMRRSAESRVKCAYNKCKFTVARGNNGRPRKFCSERCKKLYYVWKKP